MNGTFPDSDTLRSALSLANRAPSVRDSQPWRWRPGAASLNLYAEPGARDAMLSCGAVLNHCVVALAALGWQSKIHRFPHPAEPDHVAAVELYRYPAAELDLLLAAAIPRRRTDRRTYSSWPVPPGDIAQMGARAARAGVTLRRIDDSGDNAAVLALGTLGDDRLSWLRAGEATSIVLLTATALGLASCPVIGPLEIADTREALRRDVFDDDGHPQMLLRIGWAPVDAVPLPPAPLRDVARVVAQRAGSPLT